MVEWIVPVTDAVVTSLLLLIGGNLGSFLNVVVHRLPRGESVVVGGSRCPRCGAAIRWHDNVPVIGWILLRGRCRDCRAPISPRYPFVEAAAALVLGGVAAMELLSGGATLPGRGWGYGRAGADNLLLRPDPRLVAIAVFHTWLLFVLLTEAAIEADGGAPPRRFRRAALVSTLVVMALVPFLAPVAAVPGAWGTIGESSWLERALGSTLVGAAGAACGRALAGRSSGAFPAGMTLVGAALGWQASIAVWGLAHLSGILRRALGSLIPPPPCDAGVEAPGTTAEGDAADAARASTSQSRPGPTVDPLRDGVPHQPSGDGVLEGLRDIGSGAGTRSCDLVLATALFLVTWRCWPGMGG